MLLNDIQKNAREEFCQNYFHSDYSKMIFKDEIISKGGLKERENDIPIKKAIKSHWSSRNERQMYGIESD